MTGPKRSIVWLASYPKSGNTWLRAFLANYFIASDGPLPLEDMRRVSSGDASGPSYRELSGKDPALLKLPEYLKTRHAHLARIAARPEPVQFVKTHAPCGQVGGTWLIPPAITRQAIYLVRHPLDMLVSYADHWGMDFATAAARIADPANKVPAGAKTAMQPLGDWSGHVRSWRDMKGLNTLVLRYEDMLDDAEGAFARVVDHLGAPLDGEQLARAVAASSFRTLADQEAAEGFTEKGAAQARFFREGRAGQWQDVVPNAVVDRVRADHGTVMAELGYS